MRRTRTNATNREINSTMTISSPTNQKKRKKRKDGIVLATGLILVLVGAGMPVLHMNLVGNEVVETIRNQLQSVAQKVVATGPPTAPPTEPPTEPPTPFRMSRLAGLDCIPWGGPLNEDAAEMVYWEDIPADSEHVSPFFDERGPTKYLTFEPDFAGWNNVRMSVETLLAIALAMGRTLVLPPAQRLHMLASSAENQKNEFEFSDFFPTDKIHEEQRGFAIITMEEYLKLFLDGTFEDERTGEPIFPPNNRTDWAHASPQDAAALKEWLRGVSTRLRWKANRCLATFPKSTDPADMQALKDNFDTINKTGFPEWNTYIAKPVRVDADPLERMKESIAGRQRLCSYDSELQNARRLHFPFKWEEGDKSRMLVHFYQFLFFQDWRDDLWMKRFVRDHLRYVDEIQCAAARIVHMIRERVYERTGGATGNIAEFDTLHVRRGDFQSQFSMTGASIEDVAEMARQRIPANATIYIATDERDHGFFALLENEYDVLYLTDFEAALKGINANYYGMIEQLIASKGRTFIGCYYSTFSGYINRLRGYRVDAKKMEGYEEGIIPSYYYTPKETSMAMRQYAPVWEAYWAREFPTAWRLIDKGMDPTLETVNK